MKKAIFSLLILISFSAFSQNVVIFQNGNTQPMQFITDSLKTRVDSCSTAIQNGGGGGGASSVGDSLVILKQRVDSLSTALQAIGGAATLVYSGYFAQTGTNDPVVTILENTIGNIVWTRQDVGYYHGTLTGAFAELKTKPYSFTSGSNSNYFQLGIERVDNNTLAAVIETPTNPVDISSILIPIYFEIKVYQ